MAIEHHHYERAFEAYLRARRIPYVSVNEARKSLLPPIGRFPGMPSAGEAGLDDAIKSFDFIVYGPDQNFLVDIKGRRLSGSGRRVPGQRGRVLPRMFAEVGFGHRRAAASFGGGGVGSGGPAAGVFGGVFGDQAAGCGPLNSWVTQEDVSALTVWQRLFGRGFTAEFVFMYWCDQAPGDGLFEEILEHDGKWYAMKRVAVEQYAAGCKRRSAKWKTVDVPALAFAQMGSHSRVA